MDINLVIQWLGYLPALTTGTSEALAAFNAIKAAAQAAGIEHDTAQLDAVILDAAARKAREDAIANS
jgi:predicted subunit of tRNA(5-methylaminomethyl-2-thiouridylate) methyltransferase